MVSPWSGWPVDGTGKSMKTLTRGPDRVHKVPSSDD